MTERILTHEEYSEAAHREAHGKAEEITVISRSYGTYCYHRTAGVEEQWSISTIGAGNVWCRDGEIIENPDLDDAQLSMLVGRKIVAVEMEEDVLRFTADTGDVLTYTVEGDCCSRSYFYDMHGREKLLENGPVVSAREIELADPDDEDSRQGDCVQVYGYEIVTEHPKWGEQTTVFSFRNDSNGYYGGWMGFAGISKR